MLVVLCLALLRVEVFAEDSSAAGHIVIVGRVDDGVEEPFKGSQSFGLSAMHHAS